MMPIVLLKLKHFLRQIEGEGGGGKKLPPTCMNIPNFLLT